MIVNIIKARYRVLLYEDCLCFTTVPPSAARGRRVGMITVITRQIGRDARPTSAVPADALPTSLPTMNGIMHLLLLHKRGRWRGRLCTDLKTIVANTGVVGTRTNPAEGKICFSHFTLFEVECKELFCRTKIIKIVN